MNFNTKTRWAGLSQALLLLAFLVPNANGQDQRLVNAIRIEPVQDGVDYDAPPQSEWKDLQLVSADDRVGKPGWAVVDGSDRIIRLFLDNNGDGKLDQWSFFKDGLEVYRELDTDGDRSKNEYRWLGVSGIRWGIDEDQDKEIDRWKMISAEEVAQEVFLAIQAKDSKRFERLLIRPAELKQLKLADAMANRVQEKLSSTEDFRKLCSQQKEIDRDSEFGGFGTARPSLIPADQDGMGKDLVVYDHASAMFRTGDDFGQVAVGTLVQVDQNLWRVMELPQLATEGVAVANGGLFFPSPAVGGAMETAGNAEVERFTKLFGDLDKIETKLRDAKRDAQIARLEKDRADIMTQIVAATPSKEDRNNWVRSLTDQVADAYQRDRFPGGLKYLQNYAEKAPKDLGIDVAYISWRIMNSRWSKGLELDREGRDEANDRYYEELEAFISEFPKSEFSAQAMMNLANNAEINQETREAIRWYKKLAAEYGEELDGQRAKGALVRLDSGDAKVRFTGRTLSNEPFDSSRSAGRVVVIHYWDTTCDLCIDGFDELKRLNAKYKNELVLVGANLDREISTVKAFLAKNRSVNWPQLWGPGGGDESPLALQMGVSVMPTVILIDQQGKLVDSNLPVSDIDREIQRLQKRNARKDN